MFSRKGFTLIEMLIVVMVIGILASAVLVGLGSVQKGARDSRRVSDLKQVQNALELYFNRCGFYPGMADCTGSGGGPRDWEDLESVLSQSGLGIYRLPRDPRNTPPYVYTYAVDTAGSSYVLKATLEDPNSSAFRDDIDGNVLGINCEDGQPNFAYCVRL